MDGKLIGQGKKAEWDDWIGRFIGYLGEYEYIHAQDAVGVDYVWDRETKADNIVYIYGAAKGGKKEYMSHLSGELNRREGCVCYGHAFQQAGEGIANLEFQNMLSEVFSSGKEKFYFPCLRLLTEAEHHTTQNGWKAAICEIFEISQGVNEGVEKLFSTSLFQQVMGVKQLVNELTHSYNFARTMAKEETKTLNNLRAELKKITTSGSVGTLISEENPFDCLRLDLHINAKNIDSRIICMIDGFELSDRCMTGEKDREFFLKMMASVPEVVWVLFSRKTPDDEVRKVIKRENCWRMGGISKERTMRYLEEMCPGAQKNWYAAVYRHTGGHIGLLELCVKAFNTPGKKYEGSQIVRCEKKLREAMEEGDDELIEFYQNRLKLLRGSGGECVADEHHRNADEKLRKMEQQHLDNWFKKVWNDGPWTEELPEEDDERDEPLDFLFGTGRKDFKREPLDSEKRYFLPCLCYLVRQSIKDVGTIEQYCWSRTSPSIKLNNLGNRCMRIVEEEPSFCKEYEEYPGMLYLDPVIVGVVSKYRKYEYWCEVFEAECVVTLDNMTVEREAKRGVSGNDLLLPEDTRFKNVKMSESTSADQNADLVREAGAGERLIMKAVYETPEKTESEEAAKPEERSGEGGAAGASAGTQPPDKANSIHSSYQPENEGAENVHRDGKSEDDKKKVEASAQVMDEKLIVRADDDNNQPIDK